MNAVAFYFAKGILGVRDELAAIFWYHKSAMGSNVDGMIAYAWMLENSDSVSKDREEAKYYYERAAKSGNSRAVQLISDLTAKSIANQSR